MGLLLFAGIVALLVIGVGVATLLDTRKRRTAEVASGTDEALDSPPEEHKHEWRYHSSQFNPPVEDREFNAKGAGALELILHMTHGFTNITYTCTVDECPEVRVETHAGRVSNPYQGKEYKP